MNKLSKQMAEMKVCFVREIDMLRFNISMLMAALVAIVMLILIQIVYHSSLIRKIK